MATRGSPRNGEFRANLANAIYQWVVINTEVVVVCMGQVVAQVRNGMMLQRGVETARAKLA